MFRLYAFRKNGPIALLLLVLQRTPVLQAIFRANPGLPMMSAGIIRTAFLAAAAEGTVHTLTGATKFSTNPASPAAATVGTAFKLVFSVTGTPSIAQSYWVSGSIPPGLSVPNLSTSGILNAT
ncbi:MAG TPA: hypothetical protein VNI20_13370, partial [Fimbriimonadaceae bacterium]|nr:hypothetical protein [Fimbriimonadaceae bacterium]